MRVVKADFGPLRWHVVNDAGQMWRRFPTKLDATLAMAALNGDKSRAPETFERARAYGEKRGMTAKQARSYAAMGAADLGLSPSDCGVTPDGEKIAPSPCLDSEPVKG